MFGVKTFIKKNILYPQFLFPKEPDKFPNKPTSSIRIKARLWGLLNKVKDQKKHTGLGALLTYPKKQAINVWKMLLPYNPNNLGNWSIREVDPNQETAKIERELIWKMVDLYHGDKDKLEGYVTSGGTEANIFSAWIGRKFLEKRGIRKENICLLKTSLTHYSIEKAADIVNVPTYIISLNEKTWAMDLSSFEETVKKMNKKGYRGFMLPLTLGYTLTGTVDPYEEICKRIRILKKRFKIEFFVWIDAALNGLIEPFVNNNFSPFSYTEIQTFLTDFHKFGFTPIPSGIILYRKKLRKLIEKPIDYLDLKDNTLLGSRSGIAPVACWVVIHSFGKKGFKELIDRKRNKMLEFLKKYQNRKSLEFIINTRSLSLGIIKKKAKSLDSNELSKRYGLDFKKTKILMAGKTKNILIAKMFFLK